jgi:hypothetical protein
MDRPRQLIEAKLAELDIDLSSLSQKIGRNHAYLQQYMRRGVPVELKEGDREKLAPLLGLHADDLRATPRRGSNVIPPSIPGFSYSGPDDEPVAEVLPSDGIEYLGRTYAPLPVFDVMVSAGPGAFNADNRIPEGWYLLGLDQLQAVTRARIEDLALIRVSGDSMVPTLMHNDQILVDRSIHRVGRDGLYVIAAGEEVQIKRVARDWATKSLTVVSDNPMYPDSTGVQEDDIVVLGRVVWISRNVGG